MAIREKAEYGIILAVPLKEESAGAAGAAADEETGGGHFHSAAERREMEQRITTRGKRSDSRVRVRGRLFARRRPERRARVCAVRWGWFNSEAGKMLR